MTLSFDTLCFNINSTHPQKNPRDSSGANVFHNGKRGRRATTEKHKFEPEAGRAAKAVHTREKVTFHSFRASHLKLLTPSLLTDSHKIGMGQRFKISPDIFYDIFPSQTEPMSPVQSWTEERRYAVEVEEERAPHEAPATLQKYPSLLMDGIGESTRQGGRPGR